MAKVAGPVWIVAPDGGAHPEHPIVLPPDTPDNGLRPEHPIYNPGGEHPAHPIVIPDPGGDLRPEHPIAPGGETPEHPIAPGGERPTHPIAPGGEGGHPEHPIVLPPEANLPDGIWGPTDPFPTHPIVIPPDVPDGGGGTEPVGGLDFYQRKTLGFNWDPSFDQCAVVNIQAGTTQDDLVSVRQVANDGSSSVTYPQDFTGDVLIRVNGIDGYLEGTTAVK